MSDLSVCVLCYGDFPQLAKRCLNSLLAVKPGRGRVQDFRIGLNSVSDDTSAFVREWCRRVVDTAGVPCYVYNAYGNCFKYPTMRQMFFDSESPLAPYTMWFDDDSFLTSSATFWDDVVAAMAEADMIGQRWFKGFIGNQREWVMAQPWAKNAPPPGSSATFCTGGWWTIRSSILLQHDWPFPEIRHKGGDMILGELCRCQGLRVVPFDRGVRINADGNGDHSRAERRGLSANKNKEFEVGYNYRGEPLSCGHQHFSLSREVIAGPW